MKEDRQIDLFKDFDAITLYQFFYNEKPEMGQTRDWLYFRVNKEIKHEDLVKCPPIVIGRIIAASVLLRMKFTLSIPNGAYTWYHYNYLNSIDHIINRFFDLFKFGLNYQDTDLWKRVEGNYYWYDEKSLLSVLPEEDYLIKRVDPLEAHRFLKEVISGVHEFFFESRIYERYSSFRKKMQLILDGYMLNNFERFLERNRKNSERLSNTIKEYFFGVSYYLKNFIYETEKLLRQCLRPGKPYCDFEELFINNQDFYKESK